MSLAENLIKSMGVDPEQLKTALTNIVTDARAVREQVFGAKAGFQQAMQHFEGRLNRIEETLARIEAFNAGATPTEIENHAEEIRRPNGHIEHRRGEGK